MTRLDDDVQEALAQMKGFMKNAKKRKIGLATLIRQEGTKIPNVSVFRMKPYYDEYGKNVIYWYDKTSLFVIPLGKYTNQEIMEKWEGKTPEDILAEDPEARKFYLGENFKLN